jgi:hypothetical protein
MPGLDPGIHLKKVFEKKMDCRVKPGNDGYVVPANAGTHAPCRLSSSKVLVAFPVLH